MEEIHLPAGRCAPAALPRSDIRHLLYNLYRSVLEIVFFFFFLINVYIFPCNSIRLIQFLLLQLVNKRLSLLLLLLAIA